MCVVCFFCHRYYSLTPACDDCPTVPTDSTKRICWDDTSYTWSALSSSQKVEAPRCSCSDSHFSFPVCGLMSNVACAIFWLRLADVLDDVGIHVIDVEFWWHPTVGERVLCRPATFHAGCSSKFRFHRKSLELPIQVLSEFCKI